MLTQDAWRWKDRYSCNRFSRGSVTGRQNNRSSDRSRNALSTEPRGDEITRPRSDRAQWELEFQHFSKQPVGPPLIIHLADITATSSS